MVETVGEILQRPLLGCFMTVHVKGQAQGEVEPHFYDEFKGELENIWELYDGYGLQLKVEFIHDDEDPRINNGWITIREHYKLESNHHIFFKYLGKNQFQIIPLMEPITSAIFPTWHTHSRGLRKAVTFWMKITEDPTAIPELTLPEEMGEYLWEVMLDQVNIVGQVGQSLEKQECVLNFQTDYELEHIVVRITSGWLDCVRRFGFQVGDCVLFNTNRIYENHSFYVTKLN